MTENTQEQEPQPQPVLKDRAEVTALDGLKAGDQIEVNVGGLLVSLYVSEVENGYGNAFNTATGAFLVFNNESGKWICETTFDYTKLIKITV